MSIRTTETKVIFRRPFTLRVLDSVLPAGTYRLVVEEEQIPGISFVAFLRVATLLHVPAEHVPGGGTRQVISVSPDELAEAIAADVG